MDDIVTIKFVNSDARPKVVSGHCSRDFVPEIMAWYGSYYSGDRYTVYVDDVKIEKDQNGEPLKWPT